MTRFTSLALALTVTGALTGTAFAQSQAEIAASLNEEGKQLMFADKPAEAAKKFQEAVARVPEAKYFVNLCAARLQEGKLDDALTACNAVELNSPTPDQKDKAAKMIGRINDEAKKQNLELHPGGGGGGDPGTDPAVDPKPDPAHGGPPNQPPPFRPAVGRPLGQNLVMAGTPDNQYTWTLGFDGYGGGGRIGQADAFGSVGVGFRVKGDYMLAPRPRVGAELYLQYTQMSQGKDDTFNAQNLYIVDFGLAAYKHLCLGAQSRLCFTPLVGFHVSTMSPQDQTDENDDQLFNYVGVGGRAEIALTYAFGTRFEHVLSIGGGANLYSPILAGPSGDGSSSLSAEQVGLDAGGALGFLSLGYTYRFNTPLGSSPFVTLE